MRLYLPKILDGNFKCDIIDRKESPIFYISKDCFSCKNTNLFYSNIFS